MCATQLFGTVDGRNRKAGRDRDRNLLEGEGERDRERRRHLVDEDSSIDKHQIESNIFTCGVTISLSKSEKEVR